MHRRKFLQAGLAVAGTFGLGHAFWQRAYAAPAQAGPSPYGTSGTARRMAARCSRGTTAAGSWIHVSNSEIPIIADECLQLPPSALCVDQGGVGAIRFDAQGNVVAAHPVLQGTNNCQACAATHAAGQGNHRRQGSLAADPQSAGPAGAHALPGGSRSRGLRRRRRLLVRQVRPGGRRAGFMVRSISTSITGGHRIGAAAVRCGGARIAVL